MTAAEDRWWRNPQGLVAAGTIATMVLGFFYIRERQMWENTQRVQALELRGDKAISTMSARFERIEQVLSDQRDRLNFMERKIDRIEIIQKESQEARGGKTYEP